MGPRRRYLLDCKERCKGRLVEKNVVESALGELADHEDIDGERAVGGHESVEHHRVIEACARVLVETAPKDMAGAPWPRTVGDALPVGVRDHAG